MERKFKSWAVITTRDMKVAIEAERSLVDFYLKFVLSMFDRAGIEYEVVRN